MHRMFKLAAAVLVVGLAVGSAGAASVTFNGTIRDLTPANPDFEPGFWSESGSVAATLGPDGKPVYQAGPDESKRMHGAEAFHQWYHDVPGANLSAPFAITLDQLEWAPGEFYFYAPEFFPIDNAMLGNYGDSGHNFHFTIETHSLFQSQPGQFLEYASDDDLYVFIDGVMVIDDGGIHGRLRQRFNLDDLALSAGSHTLDLFYAERATVESALLLYTNISLSQPSIVPEPMTMIGLAGGLASLGAYLKRRR